MSKKRFIASIFSPIKCLKYYSSFYFHRLFNGKNDARYCMVSLSERHYKVITEYRVYQSFINSGQPVYVLPAECSITNLSQAVFSSLAASHVVIRRKTEAGADYRRLIKEKSLKRWYGASAFCYVTLYPVTKQIKIYALRQTYGSRGLDKVENSTILIDYIVGKEDYVSEQIVSLLNKELSQRKQ